MRVEKPRRAEAIPASANPAPGAISKRVLRRCAIATAQAYPNKPMRMVVARISHRLPSSANLVGVISGEVQMLISGLSAGVPAIKSGQVRALAITSPRRLAVLPDLPTIAETVPGYEADSWYVILTRAGTPRSIINKVNELSAKAINSPDVQARLIGAGIAIEVLTPEQVGDKIRKDTERWGKVVKAAGVQRQ